MAKRFCVLRGDTWNPCFLISTLTRCWISNSSSFLPSWLTFGGIFHSDRLRYRLNTYHESGCRNKEMDTSGFGKNLRMVNGGAWDRNMWCDMYWNAGSKFPSEHPTSSFETRRIHSSICHATRESHGKTQEHTRYTIPVQMSDESWKDEGIPIVTSRFDPLKDDRSLYIWTSHGSYTSIVIKPYEAYQAREMTNQVCHRDWTMASSLDSCCPHSWEWATCQRIQKETGPTSSFPKRSRSSSLPSPSLSSLVGDCKLILFWKDALSSSKLNARTLSFDNKWVYLLWHRKQKYRRECFQL